MTIKNFPTLLKGDFTDGFTDADARAALDGIAEKMARIAEIIEASRNGLTGAALTEVDLLARVAGLEADATAGDAGADLNVVWGVLFVPNEVEAQALAGSAIDKARER